MKKAIASHKGLTSGGGWEGVTHCVVPKAHKTHWTCDALALLLVFPSLFGHTKNRNWQKKNKTKQPKKTKKKHMKAVIYIM